MSIILDGTDGITTPSVTYEGDATINGLTVGRGAGAVATNTAVGASALVANTSGSTNTAVGASALDANTTGQRNVAIGHNALTNNINGGYNTAVGKNSLVTNVSGSYNTGIGEETLNTNTASNNTAIGFASLYSNTTASYQVAIGHRASYSNTTGAYNTSVGNDALYTNTTGGYNTAISAGSLVSNTTGAYNTAVGYQSLFLNTTASNNTAVGYQAGLNTTSSNNTFVGYGAGYLVNTGAKNTIIGAYGGNQGGLDIRSASNYIVLSDGDGNPRGIFDGSGNFMVNTVNADAMFSVKNTNNWTIASRRTGTGGEGHVRFDNANGNVGSIQTSGFSTSYNTSSDYRLKEDWVAVADASTRVNALKPVNFAWIASGERVDGFLAHELAEVVPEAVTGEKDAVDAEGNPQYQGIDQSKLVPLLTAALQEALAQIESLTARVTALEGN
jgi:hypothetical protein